jgi:DNA oxidative demethylase
MPASSSSPDLPPGVALRRGYLAPAEQQALADEIAEILRRAPLFAPTMPRTGAPMSVRMTNCGAFGWLSDQAQGYRYEPRHPQTGGAWPPIPALALRAWQEFAPQAPPPQACLINVYDAEARMGLHQDRNEQDFSAPIVSLSLGADCRFRLGGTKRGGKTVSFVLSSGDAMALAGPSRLRFHGVDRLLPTLPAALALPECARGGRINLTLRRVT